MKKWVIVLCGSLILGVLACGENKAEAERQAKLLTDSAMSIVSVSSKSEDLQKALELLNAAASKMPTYYQAHWNKLIIQNQLGLRDEAYQTLQTLEELRPKNPDLKATDGIFLLIKGDSVHAQQKFEAADALFNEVLDTLHNINDPYQTIRINKAINMRFMGKEQEAQALLDSIAKQQDNPTILGFINQMKGLSKADMVRQFGAH